MESHSSVFPSWILGAELYTELIARTTTVARNSITIAQVNLFRIILLAILARTLTLDD